MTTIRPAGASGALHPDFDRTSIRRLVERFYADVARHPRLATLFAPRLDGRWPAHLDRMTDFWSAVLLRDGSFKGQPVVVHRAMSDIRPEDYGHWLALFRMTAQSVFAPPAAAVVIAAAERVAESLWLASFAGPGTAPADYLRSARPSINP